MNDAELHAFFQRLFPQGCGGPDVFAEIVPHGWEDSPFQVCADPDLPADKAVAYVVGLCLWDVFSNNNDVVAADGRMVDIGSFRGAGAFIAVYLFGSDGDYMSFYMGTHRVGRLVDLTPVFVMIFTRLKAMGADWIDGSGPAGATDEEVLDIDPPAIVCAYAQVYGRSPRGWRGRSPMTV